MILTRTRFSDDGIFGELTTDAGEHVAFTLEHSYADKPKLPNGEYICVRGQHVLHSGPVETFEITGVPGHAGILFHKGNTQDDSEGCCLLGTSIVGNNLTESKKAFDHFLSLLDGQYSFQLTVR